MNDGLPWWLSGKEPGCQYRRLGFDPWVRKIPGEVKGYPLQYSDLGNSHGVAKSQTQLSDFHFRSDQISRSVVSDSL